MGAIIVTFEIFMRQRKHEQLKGLDQELLLRTKSVQVVQDVAYWAIQAVEHCIEVKASQFQQGIVADITPRLDELRAVLDKFVDQNSERNIVVSALFLANALMETKSDFPTVDNIDEYVLNRMIERKADMDRAHDQLIRQMLALQRECSARGLTWETPYAYPPDAIGNAEIAHPR